MNIPKFSIENFQFTLTFFAFFFIMGLLSFLSMPQREDPQMDIAGMLVVAVYPGANPEDIESQVVDPLEEVIWELDDIEEITTNIRDGVMILNVDFVFGVDIDEKFEEVQRQLNSIRDDLPEELYSLETLRISPSTVSVFQLALVSDEAGYKLLKSEGERLEKKIDKIDGVKKVEIVAFPKEEVRIALNAVKMTQMNISIEDIEQAIKSSNANIPGGAVKVSKRLFNLKTSGSYETLEEIRNTVVGSYQGKIIYLKNVAAVFFDFEEERWLARFNQEKAVFINVQFKDGYNVFSVAEPIKERLDAMNFAEDIRLEYVFDQTLGVAERVNGFLNSLLQGILLVGIIIFLILGYRSSSIVMMAIPLSILIGLWVVDQLDFSLQQMSIAGLVVALGLLVDNSIAIIENIERFLALGYSRQEAAIQGTQQLVAPITSATITTVLAFVPVVMMPDTTGEFVKALPITVIATLIASLIIAITLTPFIASLLLKKPQKGVEAKQTFLFRQFKRFIEGPYRNTLNWVMNHKFIMLGIAGASLVGALLLFPYVGISFFPKAEKPQFRITVQLPKGSNLEATNEAVAYVESVLSQREEVAYYAANVGHGNPRIYYNVNSRNYSNSYGDIFVVLKEYNIKEFYALLDELREELGDYPKARIDVKEFIQGPPSEAPVAIKIFGDDLDQLRAYAMQVENIVEDVAGTINVDNNLRSSSTDIYLRINRDKAMLLGVPIFAIDKAIRSYVNGASVGSFRDKEGEDYDMVMRFDYDDKFHLEDFDKISVESVTGRFVPLNQLARMEFSESPSLIVHLDKERTATVLADLDKGYFIDPVIADIDQQLKKVEWEEGYNYVYKGDLENRNESFGGMGVASALAMLLILGVLIIQFKSFSQPLIIFSALPLAIIGSIVALFVTGIPFSFTAFIGLTSLIGIAINNSIVLVDFANKLRAEGKSVLEAAKQSAEVRFIPIVLTTLTTILGLLPLTLSGGSLWAPMGWTIIGGLLTSTFFVLLVVPILYQLFTRA